MTHIKLELAGRYRLRTYKSKSGLLVKDTGWFDNLILNSGLDEIGRRFTDTQARHSRYICVGSGSASPSASDIQLGNEIAVANSGSAASSSFDTVNRFAILQRVATFPNGSAAGNISEVGARNSSSSSSVNLFSRSLVKDQDGNPTTVTVLPDEDLVVDYQYRVKQPTTDVTGAAGSRGYTMRAYGVESSQYWGSSQESWINMIPHYTGCRGGTELQPITHTTGFLTSSRRVSSFSVEAYTDGTHQIDVEAFFDTGQANGSHRLWFINGNMYSYQILFDDPIVKEATETLRLKYTVSWGRYTPPE